MIRGLCVTVASAVAIVGAAIGLAPTAGAEPFDVDCIAGRMVPGGSCYYEKCSDARAAGECNIRGGFDPHYCEDHDPDDDGLACEC
jgi:hypothetical protein